MPLSNFDLVYKGSEADIFLHQDGYALKVLNTTLPSTKALQRLNNEFNALRNVQAKGIRQIYEKTILEGRQALSMTYVPGRSWKELLAEEPNDLYRFLTLAIEGARALEAVHEAGLIHGHLCPRHLIIDQQNTRITIIDFGQAVRRDESSKAAFSLDEYARKDLYYIAPEQSGRTAHDLGPPTDLYALGVVLYQTLTGRLPITGADSLEIIHGHIARTPLQPHEVRSGIPRPLSRIIMQLLEKSPEARYSSALALKLDLTECLAQLESFGQIKESSLDRTALSFQPEIPEKLYGRQKERSKLLRIFESVEAGAVEFALVAGPSGVGKSMLVRDLRAPVKARAGFFIEGKFDAYQQDIPYYAVTQALKQLAAMLLSKEEAVLERWKKRIREKLGALGRVLIDIVPDLRWILGELPPLPRRTGPEAQNRLQYAFRRFVQAIASPDSPLVMVIDDLQWSDPNTLALLQGLSADPDISHLLLAGTYREETQSNNEARPVTSIEVLQQSFPDLKKISISNLNQGVVKDLLRDTFEAPIEKEDALAEKILQKTMGNAFHLRQLINTLVREKILFYAVEKKHWTWRREAIDQLSVSGDVLDLLAAKVQRLDPTLQIFLATAACMGTRFQYSLLELTHPTLADNLPTHLDKAVREGIILPEGPEHRLLEVEWFQFVHDRVREAAFLLLPPEKKQQIHLKIGQLLHYHYQHEQLEELVFDIAFQFNQCAEAIQSTELCLQAARINLEAGKKARHAAAFSAAYQYMKEGIRYLGADAWSDHYKLALDLHNNAAELAALNGRSAELEEYARVIDHRCKNRLDRESAHLARIKSYIARKELHRAIDLGLDYLKSLGHRFPAKPSQVQVILGLTDIHLRLLNNTPEKLAQLPPVRDPAVMAAVRLLAETTTAAYFVLPDLAPLLMFKALKLCLKYGNMPESSFAYNAFGFIQSGILGQYERGIEFGKLSMRILEDQHREDLLINRRFMYLIFMSHWKAPIRTIIPPLQDIYLKGLELGDFEIGAYAAHSYIYFSFYQGVGLRLLESETAGYVNSVGLLNQPTTLQRIQMYHQAMQNLMGRSEDPLRLKGEAYDEDIMRSVHERDKIYIALHNFHFLKAFLAYLFNDCGAAALEAKTAAKYEEGAVASFFIPMFHYLDALIILSAPGARRQMAKVNKYLSKLKKYGQNAPENYLHHYTLVRAEKARVQNKPQRARLDYDDAIYQARAAGNLLDEAIAWERFGRFHLEQQRTEPAGYCLRQAHRLYLRWGAEAKARQLAAFYQQQLQKKLSRSTPPADDAKTQNINYLSLVKFQQTLSTEIEFSSLVEKMMELVIENAGAERGLLILEEAGKWRIVAERDINSRQVKVLTDAFLDTPEEPEREALAPAEMIQYVIRTKKKLVINEVKKDAPFSDIPYLQTRAAQSILVMPLIKQGRLTGVLYLENTLTSGAFTPAIQEGLRLLSSQVAISLENARLYEDLEDKNRHNKELLAALQGKVEEQEKTLKVFAQFVPEPVIKKTLDASEVSVWEGEVRDVVVMFCDIRGFTPISEELQPREVVSLLNEYYAVMTEIILKYEGTVNQFTGDEIFSSFGAMVNSPRKELNAVRCALDMVAALPKLNETYRNKFGKTVQIGIGINAGPVVAGNLGSKAKLSYAITGDTVNTGKRIESLTKGGQNTILISECVYEKCQNFIETKTWPKVSVKGKRKMLQVYEVLGRKEA